MICFVTAFPAEAKPMIKRYGFKAFQSNPFPIYESDVGFLVISGMGKKSAAKAVSHLANLCPTNSIWVNVGIGGHKDSEIGNAFLAHKIVDLKTLKNWYPQILFSPSCKTTTVFTVDQCETQYAEDAIYDMEAAGFYEEAVHFSTAELIHSFKVISDNATLPAVKVSPKLAETLIEKNINTLNQIVNELSLIRKELPISEPGLLKWFLGRWHFTVTESHQLRRLLQRLHTLQPNKNWFDILITSLRATEGSEAISKLGIASSALRPPHNDTTRAKDIIRFLKDQIHALPVEL